MWRCAGACISYPYEISNYGLLCYVQIPLTWSRFNITHEFFHSKTTVRGSLRQLVFDKRCGTVYYPDVSGS